MQMEEKIMNQNYSQRLVMQIPQENTYTGLENSLNINREINKLSKDYKLRKISELKEYLTKNPQLIPYINSITPLIKESFPKNKRYLTYYIDPDLNLPLSEKPPVPIPD